MLDEALARHHAHWHFVHSQSVSTHAHSVVSILCRFLDMAICFRCRSCRVHSIWQCVLNRRRGSYNATSSNSNNGAYASSYSASMCTFHAARKENSFGKNPLSNANIPLALFLTHINACRRNIAVVCWPGADENGRVAGTLDRRGSRECECSHHVSRGGTRATRALNKSARARVYSYGEPGTALQATALLEAVAALKLDGEVLRHWLRDGQHFCFVEVTFVCLSSLALWFTLLCCFNVVVNCFLFCSNCDADRSFFCFFVIIFLFHSRIALSLLQPLILAKQQRKSVLSN